MTVTVSTGETLTLQFVPELQRDLLSALSASRDVVLDASEAIEADLSSLQLVVAARAQAERDGAQFSLAQPANACLAALLHRAGHTAAMNSADIDFWFHGDMPR